MKTYSQWALEKRWKGVQLRTLIINKGSGMAWPAPDWLFVEG